jgi:hypothetical protein
MLMTNRTLSRMIAAAISAALSLWLLASCSPATDARVAKRDRAEHLAAIAAKHKRIQANSIYRAQTPAKTTVKLADGAVRSVNTSSAQTNGRVVGMIDTWVPATAGSSASRVSYVVFSFVSDEAMLTQKITGTSAAVTEVWRFAQQTWCPMVNKDLTMSLTSVAVREASYDAASGKMKIDFFTGSADGVVGQIAFTDALPNSDNCNNASIQPVANTFYTVLPAPGVANSSPITGMKVMDLSTYVDGAETLTPTGEKVLFAWAGGSCAAPANFDATTGLCNNYLNGGLFRYRFGLPTTPLANRQVGQYAPDSNVLIQLMAPADIQYDYTDDCKRTGLRGLGDGPYEAPQSSVLFVIYATVPNCGPTPAGRLQVLPS